jgi:RNA polymerase-binding transcription factor DksA
MTTDSSDSRALEQIRIRLLARRTELRQRRDRVGRDLSRQLEPLSPDSDDRAIQLENDESLQVIGRAAIGEIQDIDVALDRMAQGLYGICRVCGGEISAARLDAVPQASVCQRCGQG